MFEGERVILALSIVMLKLHQSKLRGRRGKRGEDREGGVRDIG